MAGMAQATLGKKGNVPWQEMQADYGMIRDHVEKIVPGFENFNHGQQWGGVLPAQQCPGT